MSSNNKKQRQVSIKLTRTSSARPLLYDKGKTSINHLARIIDESRTVEKETIRGKIPLEQAYICMKRITDQSGQPIEAYGLSVYNRLQTLRSEHALKILRKHNWHDFFVRSDEGKLF